MLPPEVKLVANDGGRCVEAFLEGVYGENLEGIGVLDDHDVAFTVGNVDPSRGTDGRGKDVPDSL